MQKGLDYLLRKYSVGEDCVISDDGRSAIIGNSSYPVLAWEAERRIIELRNIYASGRVGEVCTYRIAHTSVVGSDLFAMLYREVGILTYTLNSPVAEIFAIAGERSMNCIVECECGAVATIELAATLKEGEEDIDKHEIICEIGVACDRVVDTQIPQHSIYVFGKDKAVYRDTDAELYGYSELECSIIRSAFRMARDEEYREYATKTDAHISEVVKLAKLSLEKVENMRVGV